MARSFSRSLQFLDADRFTPGLVALSGLMLLFILWGCWFFLAQVAVYVVSDRARLEVARETYPLQAPIGGRVAAVHKALGERVAPGDLILELDAREPRLALDQEEASRAGMASQIQALRTEAAAQQRALDEFRQAAGPALQQQQQLCVEAEAAAHLAREEANRLARLKSELVVPEVQSLQAESLARQRQASASALTHALESLRLQQRSQESDRQAALDQVVHDLKQIEGQAAAQGATVERMRQRVGRYRVTAPTAGRIGEIDNLKLGAVVQEGQLLGQVIPDGGLKIVAFFSPDRALGRIRPGQAARITLRGFPWAQYGSVSAEVSRVAEELRNGALRVELSIQRKPRSAVALQHGLPCTAEVKVEQMTPANLVLRQAGRLLTQG